ncbi:MAG: DUF6702 family protein [Flavisolibacter sp.]
MFFLLSKLAFFFLMLTPSVNAAPIPMTNINHPFYVSVMEVQQNAKEKSLELTYRIFTDDFEHTINKNYKQELDISTKKDQAAFDKFIPDYMNRHVAIAVDGKGVSPQYVGYEVDKESVYIYFEVKNVTAVKQIDVQTKLLHDYTPEQINIIHTTINGKRESVKLNYPDSKATFQF